MVKEQLVNWVYDEGVFIMSPIGGPAININIGRGAGPININIGGGAGGPLAGAGQGGCCCSCPGDGFSPSSELMGGGPGQALGIGGLPSGPALTALMNRLANSPVQLGGLTPHNSLPAAIMLGGGGVPGSIMDQGGLPPLGGGGSLTSQALMLQAASSDANQAALIHAQSGAMTGLAGAQGMALAGAVDTLSMGLMNNYMM